MNTWMTVAFVALAALDSVFASVTASFLLRRGNRLSTAQTALVYLVSAALTVAGAWLALLVLVT